MNESFANIKLVQDFFGFRVVSSWASLLGNTAARFADSWQSLKFFFPPSQVDSVLSETIGVGSEPAPTW